jgi:hypothetical protein
MPTSPRMRCTPRGNRVVGGHADPCFQMLSNLIGGHFDCSHLSDWVGRCQRDLGEMGGTGESWDQPDSSRSRVRSRVAVIWKARRHWEAGERSGRVLTDPVAGDLGGCDQASTARPSRPASASESARSRRYEKNIREICLGLRHLGYPEAGLARVLGATTTAVNRAAWAESAPGLADLI